MISVIIVLYLFGYLLAYSLINPIRYSICINPLYKRDLAIISLLSWIILVYYISVYLKEWYL